MVDNLHYIMFQKILRFTNQTPHQAERAERTKKVIELGKRVARAADKDGVIKKREEAARAARAKRESDFESSMESLAIGAKSKRKSKSKLLKQVSTGL